MELLIKELHRISRILPHGRLLALQIKRTNGRFVLTDSIDTFIGDLHAPSSNAWQARDYRILLLGILWY